MSRHDCCLEGRSSSSPLRIDAVSKEDEKEDAAAAAAPDDDDDDYDDDNDSKKQPRLNTSKSRWFATAYHIALGVAMRSRSMSTCIYPARGSNAVLPAALDVLTVTIGRRLVVVGRTGICLVGLVFYSFRFYSLAVSLVVTYQNRFRRRRRFVYATVGFILLPLFYAI